MTSGYTVTPSVYVDESGQEQISYETADVAATSGRERALNEFLHNQEDLYSYDERTGQVTHNYSDFEPEYDDYLQEYEPEEFQADIPEEDRDYIYDSVGGEESYQELMAWCYDNIPADASEEFDRLVDSGDIEAILEAVQYLNGLYLSGEYVAPEEDYDDEDELSTDNRQFVDSVYEAFGGVDNYNDAISWASENWDQEMISVFDRSIDSGDFELQQRAVDLLYSAYFSDIN